MSAFEIIVRRDEEDISEREENMSERTVAPLGNARWFFQNLVIALASGETTNGQYAMGEMHAPPGDEVPLHLHLNEDEAFYVLEGQITIWVGDQEPRVLNPGDFGFMPRGIMHCYRASAPTKTRALVITTPAGFEGFVAEVSVPAERLELPPTPPQMTEERFNDLAKISAKYGVQFLGPPRTRPRDVSDKQRTA